jgi:prolyl 4-hydroxylase
MDKMDEGIWQIKGFLSPEDCAVLVLQAEFTGFQVAHMLHMGRNNREVFLNCQNTIQEILIRLRQHVLESFHVVGIGQILECYRYQEGEFVAPHCDAPQEISSDVWSNLALIVYLNDDFEGGETVFPRQGIKINPQIGTAVMFNHSILHEGAKVFQGLKYIIRTDVSLKDKS